MDRSYAPEQWAPAARARLLSLLDPPSTTTGAQHHQAAPSPRQQQELGSDAIADPRPGTVDDPHWLYLVTTQPNSTSHSTGDRSGVASSSSISTGNSSSSSSGNSRSGRQDRGTGGATVHKVRTVKLRFANRQEQQLWVNALRVKLMDPALLVSLLDTAAPGNPE